MTTHAEVPSQWIVRLQRGEEAAFRLIYEKLHARTCRLILSLVKDTARTEELLQETFVALWLNRDKLSPEQPLYPYVYLTAKRLAIDHFRRTLLEARAIDHLIHRTDDKVNSTEETVLFDDLSRFAERTIRTLPLQQQAVFNLSRSEGLSYEEIASRLEISPNTVRNHMVSALKALRVHFGRHDVIYFLILFFLS